MCKITNKKTEVDRFHERLDGGATVVRGTGSKKSRRRQAHARKFADRHRTLFGGAL